MSCYCALLIAAGKLTAWRMTNAMEKFQVDSLDENVEKSSGSYKLASNDGFFVMKSLTSVVVICVTSGNSVMHACLASLVE